MVSGAFDATFEEAWKHLTLLASDPQVTSALGLTDCNLAPNLETDIAITGRAARKPVAA